VLTVVVFGDERVRECGEHADATADDACGRQRHPCDRGWGRLLTAETEQTALLLLGRCRRRRAPFLDRWRRGFGGPGRPGAGGAVQRSAVGAGGALVPHWSGAAVGAHELPGGSAAAGCSGSVGAGPKIPESALRRSSKAGGVSAIGGAIHSGAGAGLSVARPHCGATSEMGAGPPSLGVILQS